MWERVPCFVSVRVPLLYSNTNDYEMTSCSPLPCVCISLSAKASLMYYCIVEKRNGKMGSNVQCLKWSELRVELLKTFFWKKTLSSLLFSQRARKSVCLLLLCCSLLIKYTQAATSTSNLLTTDWLENAIGSDQGSYTKNSREFIWTSKRDYEGYYH